MEPLSPASQSSTGTSPNCAQDWSLGDHQQAKRARVENIIRGMVISPSGHYMGDGKTSSLEEMERKQENKRKQRLPEHQDHMQTQDSSTSNKSKEGQTLRKQLQTMQRLLGQLQEKFIQVYETNESEEEVSDEMGSTAVIEEDHSTWNKRSPDTSTSEVLMDPYSDFQRPFDRVHLGWKTTKLMDYIHSKPDEEGKLLADILKYELSRAVNSSVDLICKNISHSSFKLPQLHVEDRGMETDGETLYLSPHEQSSSHEDGMSRLPPCSESLTVQLPDGQIEALSLVVQKPPLTHPSSVNLAVKKPLQLDQPPLLSSHHSPLQEDQVLKNFKHTFGGLQCGSPNMSQFTSGIVDLPWDTIRVRSKVTSRPPSSPQAHPMAVGHVVLDSLYLPHVKMECGTLQSIVKRSSYVLNEGLSTNHLRKAKLMFFHTRYPSSNVLKTFFPDVQFTRCITSQLIKWFSNFREFYYIQMEKFARQARMEGIINVRDLTVDRDCELFRALNMHYNKANDFQVPDRFLEVAEITLQEFYIAISLAKDSDPSWKKAIYKVICKLDSDVPAEFKSPLST